MKLVISDSPARQDPGGPSPLFNDGKERRTRQKEPRGSAGMFSIPSQLKAEMKRLSFISEV